MSNRFGCATRADLAILDCHSGVNVGRRLTVDVRDLILAVSDVDRADPSTELVEKVALEIARKRADQLY